MHSLMELVLRDESETKAPDDLVRVAILAEHKEWLAHPHTKRFVEWLEKKISEHHDNIVNTSERISDADARIALIVEKHLKEILTYAKTTP